MSILPKLKNFLNKNKAKYKIIEHKKVYTTYDFAQTLKVDLKMIAKTLLMKTDNDFIFAVVPGNKRLDSGKLKKVINNERKKVREKTVKKLSIADETQIKRSITKKVGAIPPFGSLYKKQTYVDKAFLKQKKILLNGGSFTEAIEMSPSQYVKLEKPIEGSFGE